MTTRRRKTAWSSAPTERIRATKVSHACEVDANNSFVRHRPTKALRDVGPFHFQTSTEVDVPLVTIKPKTKEIENMLAGHMTWLRPSITKVIVSFGVPESDVQVNLDFCTTRDPDPKAPSFVLFADTCPDEKLEKRADELRAKLAQKLDELGLTHHQGAEVWLRFLPGSWCCIKDGILVDEFLHNTTE